MKWLLRLIFKLIRCLARDWYFEKINILKLFEAIWENVFLDWFFIVKPSPDGYRSDYSRHTSYGDDLNAFFTTERNVEMPNKNYKLVFEIK